MNFFQYNREYLFLSSLKYIFEISSHSKESVEKRKDLTKLIVGLKDE